MTQTIQAYPLTWPQTFPRTAKRERGQFKTSLAGAIKNVQDSLRRFSEDSGRKLDNLVVSSNVSLGVNRPADPGVAVWFVWDEKQVCIPVDRYETVEANLQAIHHILEARRVELRHGTLALVRASMQGFLALPAPAGARHWREVLGVADNADLEACRRAYKKLAGEKHPDRGGSDEDMAELNSAWAQAQEALS
jgi:hypothetical protein